MNHRVFESYHHRKDEYFYLLRQFDRIKSEIESIERDYRHQLPLEKLATLHMELMLLSSQMNDITVAIPSLSNFAPQVIHALRNKWGMTINTQYHALHIGNAGYLVIPDKPDPTKFYSNTGHDSDTNSISETTIKFEDLYWRNIKTVYLYKFAYHNTDDMLYEDVSSRQVIES